MSVQYVPISWTTSKKFYDAVLVTGVVLYLVLYVLMGGHGAGPDDQSLRIRATGSCAFLLLSLVLAIGPLARLDRRFLPVLYNRRHFGVITCTMAAAHAMAVLGWYFAFSPLPPLEAMLAADTSFGQLHGFPFIPFGIAALAILLLLAVTSHDFWLSFLTPPVWKALHMSVYAAYALVVLHVAFGGLQGGAGAAFSIQVVVCSLAVAGLHLWVGLRERRTPTSPASGGWIKAASRADFMDGRAIVVRPDDGDPVAIFRNGDRLSAVSHLCAHQNGPLGEGRVIDGCITCPWHGFQYRLEDGRAPAPFTERIATYRLALDGDTVMLDPAPNSPGTYVEPLIIK